MLVWNGLELYELVKLCTVAVIMIFIASKMQADSSWRAHRMDVRAQLMQFSWDSVTVTEVVVPTLTLCAEPEPSASPGLRSSSEEEMTGLIVCMALSNGKAVLLQMIFLSSLHKCSMLSYLFQEVKSYCALNSVGGTRHIHLSASRGACLVKLPLM